MFVCRMYLGWIGGLTISLMLIIGAFGPNAGLIRWDHLNNLILMTLK